MVDVRNSLDGVAPTAHPLDMDAVRHRAVAIAAADQRRHRHRFTAVAAVLVLALVIAVPTFTSDGEPAILAGGAGLPGIAGPSVTGEGDVALAEFAGEPLLVHLWAPWCDYCNQIWLPDLAAYAEQDDAVQVITAVIAADAEAAAATLADARLDVPTMMLPNTDEIRSLLPAEVASQAPFDALPMTLAFNATGTLVQVRLGAPPVGTSPGWTPDTWYQELADIARTAEEYTPYGVVGAQATPPPSPSPLPPTPSAVPTEPFNCDALPERSGSGLYEVQVGDTLSTIAEAVYGDPTAFGALAAFNELNGTRPLCVGEMLLIPDNPDAFRAFETLPVNDQGERIYTVQPGDTLSTIATTVYADPTLFGPIADANGLTNGTPLQASTTLVIPNIPGLTDPPAPAPLQPPASVTPIPVPPDLAEAIAATHAQDITEVTEQNGASTWRTSEGLQITFRSGELMEGTSAEDVVAQEVEPPGAAPITLEDGTVTAVSQDGSGGLMLAPLPSGDLLLVEFGPSPTYSGPTSERVASWVTQIRAALS